MRSSWAQVVRAARLVNGGATEGAVISRGAASLGFTAAASSSSSICCSHSAAAAAAAAAALRLSSSLLQPVWRSFSSAAYASSSSGSTAFQPHLTELLSRVKLDPRSWRPTQRNLTLQFASRRQLEPKHVLYGLIAANAAVFGAWQVVDKQFMQRHFAVSIENIRSHRYHTLVTSCFSQMEIWHLAANMLGLYFFGVELAMLYGGNYLLNLYLAGGVAGSIAHLAHQWYKARKMGYDPRWTSPALGASGAVNAIVINNVLLFPWRIVYINFFIPVPAILLGLLYLSKDFFGMRSSVESGIGHAAHLGGAATGAIVWAMRRFRYR
eukprot:jgi/Chlat1/8199/Chrsp76S07629